MDYELCKKLKDAGFKKCKQWETIGMFIDSKPRRIKLPFPTLSELIAACEDKFISLVRNADGVEWKSIGTGEPLEPEEAYGKTPEIAVANLYLALKSNGTKTQ